MSHIVTGIAQRKVVGSSAKKAVFMLMAGCASDDGSGVWASKANMARDLEMSKRTVQAAIEHFKAIGLIFEVGKRPSKNGYTYIYDINLTVLNGLESTRAGDAPVQEMHPTRAGDAPQEVQEMHPNLIGTVKEPKVPPIVPQDGFDEFWDSCPKQTGKGDARRAYAKALKKTDRETILSAMRRYAAERDGEDPQFTKTPAPWLNAERWADAPKKEFTNERHKSGNDIATRAAERWTARQMDSGQSSGSSQPLLSARQPTRRIGGGS